MTENFIPKVDKIASFGLLSMKSCESEPNTATKRHTGKAIIKEHKKNNLSITDPIWQKMC